MLNINCVKNTRKIKMDPKIKILNKEIEFFHITEY